MRNIKEDTAIEAGVRLVARANRAGVGLVEGRGQQVHDRAGMPGWMGCCSGAGRVRDRRAVVLTGGADPRPADITRSADDAWATAPQGHDAVAVLAELPASATSIYPYQYAQFCRSSRTATLRRSMRQVHRAGEKLFVDYAGQTVPAPVNPDTSERARAHIFVACWCLQLHLCLRDGAGDAGRLGARGWSQRLRILRRRDGAGGAGQPRP